MAAAVVSVIGTPAARSASRGVREQLARSWRRA